MRCSRSLTLAVCFACAALHTGCTGGAPSGGQPDSNGVREVRGDQINGAGATFPNPLYSKWFAEYHKIHPDVRINYQSLGSGAGIRQLTSGTVFFGASDQPVNNALLSTAPGKILHFPTVLGAVVPIYNLGGVSQPLKFTGPLLADIILGRIRTWNDPAIVKHNTGVALPGTEITFVHRSEGSGTTFILADYLAKVSPEFKSVVGVDASLKWPTGVGGKGNEGVAALVRQTPGSLGYVELVYALQTRIAVGAVQNSSGAFVTPSIDSVTAAATAATGHMPRDFRVSITNAAGADAYPISSFTWLLLYEEPRDKIQGRQMREFLRWALTDGQKLAPQLGYAPLPRPVVEMELRALDHLKVN